MWLLLAFIAVPLIEIGLFIKVGGWLTLWPTLGIVLATGMIGMVLVRAQGLRVLAQLRQSMEQMRDPVSPLAHGAMIVFAGLLLLTPGFFTDAIGFLLLVPALRQLIIARIVARMVVVTPQRRDDVIEGAFSEVVRDAGPKKPPSGWTKH
ncbi:UPF0716 protein FxsA [Pseudorhodobacter antarcticus]|uniref:UPF0716 protein FxsA n=1 Tax=Pseudorhodobacter antarcticus TaxID=1077947 RepID=A0A1H8C1J2_9RHOB|nr:FxsA family protein [Pseudorhodobacter antarcticus]SEM88862.1 UPF0716 protein FxsA [Pseudorhodobacter antarcticus]